jgi:hypothetical protein
MARIQRMRQLVPTLRRICILAASLATVSAAESVFTSIEAPDVSVETNGLMIAPRGFVGRMGERLLMCDHLRYDPEHDDLYANGKVVYVMPVVRIHADRVGLHPKAESGEAWNLHAQVETKDRRFDITAKKGEFTREALVFRGVRGASYGGILSLGASTVRVNLREEAAEDRKGFERSVESITLYNPHIRLVGVPVFWLPAAHRDFILDYPWTRFEFGRSSRLGNFFRSWIGSSLPEFWGLHAVLIGRFDSYTSAGKGVGGMLKWKHALAGTGLFSYFGFNPEHVHDYDDGSLLSKRQSYVADADHRARIPGGAVSARWVHVPDADPLTPHGSTDGVPPDERFRADFMRDDLETRPFARRGATGTWGNAFGNVVLDTELKHHDELTTTDRLVGLQLEVPQTGLIGPLHAGGNSWAEQLRNDFSDTQALRVRNEASLTAVEWFGSLGLDGSVGGRGLHYDDATVAGADIEDDERRYVAFSEDGIRTRFIGEFNGGLIHTITPRLGVELISDGAGDDLSTYNFGDDRDELEEDKRYGVTSIDTNLGRDRVLFRARFVARWALRSEDREFIDSDGSTGVGDTALVDLTGSIDGHPTPTVELTGNFNYDARRDEWRRIDAGGSWVAHPRVKLRDTLTLLPVDVDRTQVWQDRVGLTLYCNRYVFDNDFTFRPDGANLDAWSIEIKRRMVDGDLALGYEQSSDADGHLYDRSTSISFEMR